MRDGKKDNQSCIQSGYCPNAKYEVVNSSMPAPKYIDGFICKLTGQACIAKHYQLK